MAGEVELCNRALQKLGAARITSLEENSVNARAVKLAYETLLSVELQDHPWNFAIQRYSVAEDLVPPAWGRAKSFTMPAGYLKILPPYPEQNYNYRDWIEESGKIITNDGTPLQVRCVMAITDASKMSALFRDMLAARIAWDCAEQLTQSNSKNAQLEAAYEKAKNRAKRHNASQNVPMESVTDTWITGRS